MELYLHTGLSVRIIDELKSLAEDFGVEKIILFGSRARGDYKERSDIDIAFSGGKASSFILAVDEDVHTLLNFDIIDLDGAVQEELRESIEKEGIIIYEKI